MPETAPPKHYKWIVMGIVLTGTFMSILTASIVNVALPHIMAAFSVGLDEVKWVITAFILASAVLMPATGWARDHLGTKFTYVVSLTVFTLGSVLCGLAWNNTTLVFARILQALGGGAIMPTGMTLITEVFEPHERGSAIGLWGLGAIIAPAIGPTLGGVLVDTLGWRSIFFVNLPIGLLGVIAAQVFLREGRRIPKPFDFRGFALLSIAIIGGLYALAEGQTWGWTSPVILLCGAGALLALMLFVKTAWGREHAILDLSLFKIRNVWASGLLGFARSVALFGSTFLLPVYLQNVMGLSATTTGLLMMPGAIAIGLSMPLSGRISDRIGARSLAILGVILTGCSIAFYYGLRPESGTAMIVVPLAIRGVGIGMLLAPVTAAAMNAVPPQSVGMASGMLNLLQQIGGAVGISLLETIIQYRIAVYRLDGGAGKVAHGHAFNDAFLVAGGIVLLGLVPALAMRNVRAERKEISVGSIPE